MVYAHHKLADSVDVTMDPDSVACVATFLGEDGHTAFHAYLAPISKQILDVLCDFGDGVFERFSADRIFPG